MYFHPKSGGKEKPSKPADRKPPAGAEERFGSRDGKRSLWDRLNPRHRKTLRVLAEALAAEQGHSRLDDSAAGKFRQLLSDVEHRAARAAALLAELARRTRPRP